MAWMRIPLATIVDLELTTGRREHSARDRARTFSMEKLLTICFRFTFLAPGSWLRCCRQAIMIAAVNMPESETNIIMKRTNTGGSSKKSDKWDSEKSLARRSKEHSIPQRV